MLVANNRLPKRINANGQEVEKLVVSGTIWFDATSTIPAEGGVSSGTFSRISQVMGFKYKVTSQPDIPAAKSAGILYKDKDGYCYAIDKTTGQVVKFNTTLEDDGIILDASDASPYYSTVPIWHYTCISRQQYSYNSYIKVFTYLCADSHNITGKEQLFESR